MDSLNRAILHLHEPIASSHFSERVFEAASMILPYEVAGLSMSNGQTKGANTYMSVPAHDAFLKLLEHADEVYAMPGFADGTYHTAASPVSLLDFSSVDAFKGSAMYEFFYKEMDVLYETSINYYTHANGTNCQLNLARKRKRYTAEERGLLGWFLPHLRQRFQQLLATEPQRLTLSLTTPITEQTWIVCASSGRIRSFSPCAPAIFRRLGLSLNSSLPNAWMIWFQGQLQPISMTSSLQPLLLRNGRHCVAVHCVPNRLSGEHRLILLPDHTSNGSLTEREREIGRWIAEGKSNSEIATILDISVHTVKRHIERVLEKLGVENRTAAGVILARDAAAASQ